MAAKKKSKTPKPMADEKALDAFINEICAFHGYRRERWDDNKHVVFGLRGPAGALALDMIRMFRLTVLTGALPKLAPAAEAKT